LLSLLAVLLTAASLFSAEPSLKFGVPVPWPLDDGKTATALLIAYPGDATRAQLLVAKPGDPPIIRVYVVLLGEQPKPDPKPIPPPPPPPPPAELWGIIIEESSHRTPQQAIVLSSPAIRSLFDQRRFRLVDKDSEVGADMKPYADRAKGKTLPMLFLAGGDGTIYYEGGLPATVAEMTALVGQWKKGGGK
jgi:hypothetical protein